MQLSGAHCSPRDCDFYLAVSNAARAQRFVLPPAPAGGTWLRLIDTGRAAPDDFVVEPEAEPVRQPSILLRSFSCVLLRSR
jgi:hypothetical protein